MNGRGTDSLIAEQLIRSRLLIVRPFPIVENVLVVVAAVLVVVQGLGLACVNLRERRLRLEVLRVACRMGEGTGGRRGGGFAWFRGGCRGCRCRRGSCRRGSLMLVYGVRRVDVVLAVLVQTANKNSTFKETVSFKNYKTCFKFLKFYKQTRGELFTLN